MYFNFVYFYIIWTCFTKHLSLTSNVIDIIKTPIFYLKTFFRFNFWLVLNRFCCFVYIDGGFDIKCKVFDTLIIPSKTTNLNVNKECFVKQAPRDNHYRGSHLLSQKN